MKYLIVIGIFTMFAGGCRRHKKPLFNSLEYSFSGFMTSSYTMKFTQSDTVYIKIYSTGLLYDSLLKDNTTYFALLSHEQRNTLDSLVKKTDLQKLDTSYYENYFDGSTYQFYFQKEGIQKLIDVHSYHNVPKQLDILSDTLSVWMGKMREELRLRKTDATVYFYNEQKSEYPKPCRFPIPKVEN